MNQLSRPVPAARASAQAAPRPARAGGRKHHPGRALVLLVAALVLALAATTPASAQPRCLAQQPTCGPDQGKNAASTNKPQYQLQTPAAVPPLTAAPPAAAVDSDSAAADAADDATTTTTTTAAPDLPPADEVAAAVGASPAQGALMEQLALMMQPRAARVLQQSPEEQAAKQSLAAAERERAEEAEFGRAAIAAPPAGGGDGALFARLAASVPSEDEATLRSYMRPRLPVASDGQDLAYTSEAREGAIRFPPLASSSASASPFSAAAAREAAFVPSSSINVNGNAAANGNAAGPGARNGTLFLSRGALRVGVDCSRGATIFYLGLEGAAAQQGERAARGVPGDLLGKSLVNGYDCGRGLQQSYYGCWDGSCWPPGKSWLYNPVQCGSWTDKPSTVMRCEMLSGEGGSGGSGNNGNNGNGNAGARERAAAGAGTGGGAGVDEAAADGSPAEPLRQRIVTSVIPRNWGGGQLLPEVRMDSDVALSPTGEVARIRFSMSYGAGANSNGNANARVPAPPAQPVRMQEVPAVFVDRRLSTLVFYNRTADREWTDAQGRLTLAKPRGKNDYFLPTERWAAYVVPGTAWGVGVYSPSSDVVTAYRVGPDPASSERAAPASDVSYFAPTVKFPLTPGQTYTYDVYVAVGRVGDLRAHFARIAERTGRAPAGSAKAMAAAAEAASADVGARTARGLVGGGGGGTLADAPTG